MLADKKGIKETVELFDGLGLVAKAVKEVMKDGKVDFSDAAIVVELAKSFGVLSAALEGIKEVPEELKDLDREEILELIMKIYKEVA